MLFRIILLASFIGLLGSLPGFPNGSLPNSPSIASAQIIATGAYRQHLKSLPIEMRPNRPLHFYGNAVRRRSTTFGGDARTNRSIAPSPVPVRPIDDFSPQLSTQTLPNAAIQRVQSVVTKKVPVATSEAREVTVAPGRIPAAKSEGVASRLLGSESTRDQSKLPAAKTPPSAKGASTSRSAIGAANPVEPLESAVSPSYVRPRSSVRVRPTTFQSRRFPYRGR